MKTQSIIQTIAASLLSLSLLVGGTMMQQRSVQAATVQVADPEIIYTVVRGDTLYAIARRYNTTVSELMRYNSLSSTLIYVGQRLLIPVANVPQGPSEPIVYVVQPGDTLSGIARRYNTTVVAIKQYNGLNRDTIYVGQRLQVPVGTNVPNPPPPPPTPGTVERIQFRPGANSDTRGGAVSASDPRRYVLWAAAGQQMSVQLKTTSVHLNFFLFTPSGENLAVNGGGMQAWSGRLPLSGDYVVEVRHSGTGLADYGITVTVTNVGNGNGGGSNGDGSNGDGSNGSDDVVQTAVQYVMAQADIAIHNAPRPASQVIGNIAAGMIAKVTGVSVDGQWWRVICPDDSIGSCWVLAQPGSTQPTTAP